jgi:formylglycine-generating enzyme required for sulfatase activity
MKSFAHIITGIFCGLLGSAMPSVAQSAFAPTIPNKIPAPTPTPEGMVWIPGGEFSMGSDKACEGVCDLPGVTRDATPIHRVYVDEKKRIHRGGSFLCTSKYRTRYMTGTRGKGEVSTASNHLGFRCVTPVTAASP